MSYSRYQFHLVSQALNFALSTHFDEDGHVDDIVAIPDGEGVEELKAVARRGNVDVVVAAVGNRRLNQKYDARDF